MCHNDRRSICPDRVFNQSSFPNDQCYKMNFEQTRGNILYLSLQVNFRFECLVFNDMKSLKTSFVFNINMKLSSIGQKGLNENINRDDVLYNKSHE